MIKKEKVIIIKISIIALSLILVATFVLSVSYESTSQSLDFSYQDTRKIISLETETQPLLVSYTITGEIKKFIEISANKELRISRTEPLILTIESKNPSVYKEGSIMINTIYEELPENLNDYSDDTILIPVRLNSQTSSPDKAYITLSEPKEADGIALGADITLPIAIMIIILFILKKKWKK